MQLSGRGIKALLKSAYERRVVLLCGFDGFMPQQQLHGANVFASEQKLNCKRVSESMRSRPYSRNPADARDRAPRAPRRRRDLRFATPEEVRRFDWQFG